MRQALKAWKRICRETRGGILLEYVILMTLIILPLLGLNGVFLFNPSGTQPDGTPDFGLLGNSFTNLYQRSIVGVGSPAP
jgi:hypothetical protein